MSQRTIVLALGALPALASLAAPSHADEQRTVRNGNFEGDACFWRVTGEPTQLPRLDREASLQCTYATLPFVSDVPSTLEQKFLLFEAGDCLEVDFRYRVRQGTGSGCPGAEAWLEIELGASGTTGRIPIPLSTSAGWHDFVVGSSAALRVPRPADAVMGTITFGTIACDPTDCGNACTLELDLDDVELCVTSEPCPSEPKYDALGSLPECDCTGTTKTTQTLAPIGPSYCDEVVETCEWGPLIPDLTPIPSLPFVDVGDTAGALDYDLLETSILDGPGVWYRLTGDGRRVEASSCLSGASKTSLFVYRRVCGDYELLEVENGNACNPHGIVSWQTQRDVDYYVLLATVGSTGPYRIDVVYD